MKINEEDVTFLIPIYNTNMECFLKHRESMKKFTKAKIIYWNDGITDMHLLKTLKDDISDCKNTTLYSSPKNMGTKYTTYLLSLKAQTKYIVRVDSDDQYYKLPEYHFRDADFDILLFKNVPMSFLDMFKINTSFNGSVLKTSVYKKAVSVLNIDKTMNRTFWMNEDAYFQFSILVPIYREILNLKIVHCSCGSSKPIRCFHSLQTTTQKVTRPKMKRWDTFLLWCIDNNEPELYREMSIKFHGISESIKQRLEAIKESE